MLDGHILNTSPIIDRVDGRPCLDLETLRGYEECLDERFAYGAIAGHDVVKAVTINSLDHAAYEVVVKATKARLFPQHMCRLNVDRLRSYPLRRQGWARKGHAPTPSDRCRLHQP